MNLYISLLGISPLGPLRLQTFVWHCATQRYDSLPSKVPWHNEAGMKPAEPAHPRQPPFGPFPEVANTLAEWRGEEHTSSFPAMPLQPRAICWSWQGSGHEMEPWVSCCCSAAACCKRTGQCVDWEEQRQLLKPGRYPSTRLPHPSLTAVSPCAILSCTWMFYIHVAHFPSVKIIPYTRLIAPTSLLCGGIIKTIHYFHLDMTQ